MDKTFLLHDLEQTQINTIQEKLLPNTTVFAAAPLIKNCIGCFGCWTKTPGECVIHDRGEELPTLWASSSQVVIISRWVYGGYSPSVKACVDRSLGYILPYFRIVNNEMHHEMRYKNSFHLIVYFYGDIFTEAQKEFSKNLVKANALNYGAKEYTVYFPENIEEIQEAII